MNWLTQTAILFTYGTVVYALGFWAGRLWERIGEQT